MHRLCLSRFLLHSAGITDIKDEDPVFKLVMGVQSAGRDKIELLVQDFDEVELLPRQKRRPARA